MENPTKKEWGDQPEIEAMSQLLQAAFTVCHHQNNQIVPKEGADHGVHFSNRLFLSTQPQIKKK